MKNNRIYLRFLNLLEALEDTNGFPDIDLEANKILEVIAVRHQKETPLTVTEAMALSHIASPATIHRKLDELREVGLIEQVFEGKNRRTKYLVPTKLADAYFAKLSKAITSAVII
jgi:DNA-binding MarR family transcriptional regulator